MGGGQGGPGLVVPYHDDGVPPGPGELEEEARYDEEIRHRVFVLEETITKKFQGGKRSGDRDGAFGPGAGNGW